MTATTEDNNPSISMLRLTAEHLLNSRLPGGDYEERSYRSTTMNKLEVAVGLEPTKIGFADRSRPCGHRILSVARVRIRF